MKKIIGFVAVSLIFACGPVRPTGSGGSGGTGASAGTGGSSAGTGGGGNLPCDVDAVLKAKCQACHADPPQFGAPMPLVTYANTQVPALSNPSVSMWEQMKTRVDNGTMPQGSYHLTDAEKATLDNWFASGAPSSADDCSGAGGTGGTTGSGGTGGIDPNSVSGEEYLPCQVTHRFRAHAPGNLAAKYPVPNPTNDLYVCFNFKSPFAANELATAFANVIDDSRVIHHWILYGTNSNVGDGTITSGIGCASTSVSSTFVTGWAPGGTNGVMPDDIGLKLDYQYFVLQVHYNNHSYNDAADASGPSFCSTTEGRPHVAGVVSLGSSPFTIPAGAQNYGVTSTCTDMSTNGTPITIISTSPHMHVLGTGFRTTHTRGGVDQGDIVNLPLGSWDFNHQFKYGVDRRVVNPGDVLTTTCYYNNTTPNAVSFGTKTTDEMCYNFITAYPYDLAKKKCGPLL